MRSSEPEDQGSAKWTPIPSKGEVALLDYAVIGRYWSKAKPSIMGPYMMNGFGFPANAGSYRFGAERKIVDRLIRSVSVDSGGTVLDLGSGIGFWTEYFAQRFGILVNGSTAIDGLSGRAVAPVSAEGSPQPAP